MTRHAALCSVVGCGRRHYGHGYCRPHHARWRRHGDPQPRVPVRRRDADGYWSARQRVTAERGPATAYRCGCGAPAVFWSYDLTDPRERVAPGTGYRYSLDPAHYRPCCRSCHRRAVVARAAPKPRARLVDVERAARLYRAGATVPGIAALLGVSRTAVYTALRTHGVPIRPAAPARSDHEDSRCATTTAQPSVLSATADEPAATTTQTHHSHRPPTSTSSHTTEAGPDVSRSPKGGEATTP